MKTCKPFNSFLKSILFCFLLLNLVASKAQLSGTYHIPSDYSTLATAIADLNSQGVSAAVTIVVDASSPQTAPAGGYVIGGAGSALLTSTSAVNTVTINGGGTRSWSTTLATAAPSKSKVPPNYPPSGTTRLSYRDPTSQTQVHHARLL